MEATTEKKTELEACCEHELKHLQSQWVWLMVLGVLLAFLGLSAIAYTPLASFAFVWVLGILLIIGGAATILSAFWAGRWSATLLQILVGILYLIVGIGINDVTKENPLESVFAVTLVLAACFIIIGLFRMIAAMVLRFHQWGWALLNGGLTFLIGAVIYRNLPDSALWALGLLIGIELLFNGLTWIMLALEVRSLPAQEE